MLKHSHTIAKGPSAKYAEISVSNGVGNLPADFDTPVRAALHVIPAVPIDENPALYFYEYDIIGSYGAKQVRTNEWVSKLHFAYVPGITDLTGDTDVPTEIPSELSESIADFAVVEYFRAQRDNAEAMNALTIAQSYLNDRLSRL